MTEVCGNCKHHRPDRPEGGDINEWFCNNEDSEYYTDLTEYGDGCDSFEERWKDADSD